LSGIVPRCRTGSTAILIPFRAGRYTEKMEIEMWKKGRKEKRTAEDGASHEREE